MQQTEKIVRKLLLKYRSSEVISEAFVFAKEAYKDKFRLSGENYIHHAVRVAQMLSDMGLDESTVAFAILHDALDEGRAVDRETESRAIEKKFGKDIAYLIDCISTLGRIRYALRINLQDHKRLPKEKLESIRRMFLAIAGDVRVVLVELASRLDGLKFLTYLPRDQQQVFALETLRIFVPIANRLGLSSMRRDLEDESFAHLFPDDFKAVKESIETQYAKREKSLKSLMRHLGRVFKKEHVKVLDMNWRTKSYWSTYQKLLRKNMDFNQIHDLLALRVITDTVENCYKVLGVIHKHYRPISEEIDDYIAKPKKNGYRSLHTTILSNEDKITEVQIRTEEMHQEAELGVCAHWAYKERVALEQEGKKFSWVKHARVLEKNFQLNFFEDELFAFTPKGDIIALPKKSTPVDFAYAVHSEVGNKTESAKVNGKMVALDHPLENGDIVEITTGKGKVPSKDWLRFVKTNLAKSHIKKATETVVSRFKLPIPGFITRTIAGITQARQKRQDEQKKIKKGKVEQIFLAGQKGILMRKAKCCNPQSGDKIKAYLAPHRTAVLHRTSCETFKKVAEKFPDKIIDASWQ